MVSRPLAVITVLATSAVVVALASLRIDPVASVEAGRANLRHLWPYWVACGVSWSTLTALAITVSRAGRAPCVGRRRVAWGVLVVAAAARIAVLATHEPQLSDDVFRYVFDGRNLAHGVNPYLVRPQERLDAVAPRWPGEAAVVARTNNPELHTIYLPTSQWLFAATAVVMPEVVADPVQAARWFRGALIAVELVLIALLLGAVRRAGRSAWWVALYAWHPLAITEVAGSGHQEPLGILLLVAALSLGPARVGRAVIALAAAALVKPVVVPVAGLLLRRRSWTAWLGAATLGAAVCLALGGPLLLAAGGEPLANLGATATRFSLKWAHFGSVYEPLLWLVERLMPGPNDPQERLARLICAGVLAVIVLVIIARRPPPWRGASAMMLAMVLLAPAVHPWYLLWALALVPMTASPAVWIASLTLPWGYAAWGYAPDPDGNLGWGVSPWLMVAAYAPVYAALLLTMRRRPRP